VHCCAQVLSFQCRLPNGVTVSDLPALLNSHLPRDSTVRVWAAISLGSQFNAQRLAESRRYHYLLPLSIIGAPSFEFVRDEVMPRFVGAHNFHNYTKRVSATNPSATRTIHEFSLSDPFDVHRRPFVLFSIRGNSFMLNQIRKMIGTVIAIANGRFAFESLDATFGEAAYRLPLFPGEGLFLDQVEYPGFLRAAYRGQAVPLNRDVEFRACRPQIEEWKQKTLFPHIADLVLRERTFESWLERFAIDDREN
jgi:tRNA pseudouridine38-40 synthase